MSGWGTGIVVNANIVDAAGVGLWQADIDCRSGLQWLGPSMSQPDDSYVKNFVTALVDTMKQAGLFGEA